jgi:hypothetical protein
MHETLTGFAALALLGFIVGFGVLMLFMVLVQPIWSVVDCAIDPQRGTAGKVLWVLALILMWGVANWFYGAFAAANRVLRRNSACQWNSSAKAISRPMASSQASRVRLRSTLLAAAKAP